MRRGKKEDLLLASFLALALDLILSACRFLSSSSVSPEAATTLSSSHQHCQFGHLRTCAQAIQSDTLAGAKKLSNVFIIITFLSYRLPFRSLISSPPPLPPPPALSSPSHLPSLPPYHRPPSSPLHPPTTHPLPPHSAPASTFLYFYPFNSDNLVFSNRRRTERYVKLVALRTSSGQQLFDTCKELPAPAPLILSVRTEDKFTFITILFCSTFLFLGGMVVFTVRATVSRKVRNAHLPERRWSDCYFLSL